MSHDSRDGHQSATVHRYGVAAGVKLHSCRALSRVLHDPYVPLIRALGNTDGLPDDGRVTPTFPSTTPPSSSIYAHLKKRKNGVCKIERRGRGSHTETLAPMGGGAGETRGPGDGGSHRARVVGGAC